LSQYFDRHARQYIADHEGIHNDNDPNSESNKADDGKIKTLMINIESLPESPTYDQAELFLTLIGSIQQREATYTAINLADRSFAYAVTGTYPIGINNTDLFAYIMTNWYMPNK
jgi:hypothetical protein